MNAQMHNQVRFANSVRHMVLANGLPICHKCAMVEYRKVSREARPLVDQWNVYEDVRCAADEVCRSCGH